VQDFFHHQNEQNNHVNKYMMYKHVYLSKLMCTDETLSVRSVTSFIHAKKNKELLREDSFKPWLMIMMIPKFPNFGDGFQTNK